jgi:hypothetical protein
MFSTLGADQVEQLTMDAPKEYSLAQNYPNPFNAETTLRFSLVHPQHVSLVIYDIRGSQVAQLLDGGFPSGTFQVRWKAEQLASGVFVCRIHTSEFTATRKLLLMK